MLPELTTWAKPNLAEIPLKPPAMLAPASLVTVALVLAKMPFPLVPVMLAGIGDIGKASDGVNSAPAGDGGAGIVGHRRVGEGENAVAAGAGDAAGIGDIGKACVGENSVWPPVMLAAA